MTAVIITVLALALLAAIYYIKHQRTVHAAALKEKNQALQAAYTGSDFFREHRNMLHAELEALKLKIEADAKALAAEPAKIAAAVKSRVSRKKA